MKNRMRSWVDSSINESRQDLGSNVEAGGRCEGPPAGDGVDLDDEQPTAGIRQQVNTGHRSANGLCGGQCERFSLAVKRARLGATTNGDVCPPITLGRVAADRTQDAAAQH